MNTPDYILRFDDGRMGANEKSIFYRLVRYLLALFVILTVTGSLATGSFLLADSSPIVWVGVLAMVICLITGGGHHRGRCYTELWFYEDCFVQYIPRHYYSGKKSRKEYRRMNYRDVKECTYRVQNHKILFLGKIEGIFYQYNRDGTLKEKPSYHKTTDSGTYFYTVFEPEIDFVKEIEEHTPLKVAIE